MKANIFNIQKFSIHDGPGIRTVVFFKGCPLNCLWCSNPESQSPHTQLFWDKEKNTAPEIIGKQMDIEEVMKEILKDKDFYEESGGGVTLSGGEVMLQHEFASHLLLECKKYNLSTALETTGYTSHEIFVKVIEHADLLLFDMKHYDSKKHLEYTGVPNEIILSNMAYAVSIGKSIIARIPVIPGVNNTIQDAIEFCKILKEIKITEVNLLPFHQFGQNKYKRLGREYKMEQAKALHPEDLNDYFKIFVANGFHVVM